MLKSGIHYIKLQTAIVKSDKENKNIEITTKGDSFKATHLKKLQPVRSFLELLKLPNTKCLNHEKLHSIRCKKTR